MILLFSVLNILHKSKFGSLIAAAKAAVGALRLTQLNLIIDGAHIYQIIFFIED